MIKSTPLNEEIPAFWLGFFFLVNELVSVLYNSQMILYLFN